MTLHKQLENKYTITDGKKIKKHCQAFSLESSFLATDKISRSAKSSLDLVVVSQHLTTENNFWD